MWIEYTSMDKNNNSFSFHPGIPITNFMLFTFPCSGFSYGRLSNLIQCLERKKTLATK